jgi:hypothetical protein
MYNVIYAFCPQGNCGNAGGTPQSSLTLGSDGYLYGMTLGGVVYKVSTSGEFTVVSPGTNSTNYPVASLVQAMSIRSFHRRYAETDTFTNANIRPSASKNGT